MFEIPTSRLDWRLDVVSILAILGESNIKLNAHLITASRACLLPRLMPAPQALLGEERLSQLPFEEGVRVIGSHNLNYRDVLNFFPTMLHGSEGGKHPFNVRMYTLEYHETRRRLSKRRTRDGSSWDVHDQSTEVVIEHRPLGPLNVIAIGSCLMSVGLVVWSILIHDPVALMGILIMSFTTPLLCLNNLWSPQSQRIRKSNVPKPPGDVVTCSRDGSFCVIKCRDEVSRNIYFNADECRYRVSSLYGRASGGVLGGLMLIVAIIFFGNCTWVMQLALAVAYSLLNVSYWIATILPPKWSWNLQGLDLKLKEEKQCDSYTEALWQTIYYSGTTKWCYPSKVLPDTDSWRGWLEAAKHAVAKGDANWRAGAELDNQLVKYDSTHAAAVLHQAPPGPQQQTMLRSPLPLEVVTEKTSADSHTTSVAPAVGENESKERSRSEASSGSAASNASQSMRQRPQPTQPQPTAMDDPRETV